MKTDLEKQEQIIEILWDLVRDQQHLPHDCTSGRIEARYVSVNLGAMRRAHDAVMATFGFEVIPIQ